MNKQAIAEDDEADAKQVLTLRRLHLAVNLGQAFLAAHRQQANGLSPIRMATTATSGDLGALQPAERVVAEMQIGRDGCGHRLVALHGDGEQAPCRPRITTITVVICITRKARVLENGMPTVLVHQK